MITKSNTINTKIKYNQIQKIKMLNNIIITKIIFEIINISFNIYKNYCK